MTFLVNFTNTQKIDNNVVIVCITQIPGLAWKFIFVENKIFSLILKFFSELYEI